MASTKEYNIKINGIKENVDGVKSLKDQTTDYAKAVRETNKEIKSLQGQMLGLDKSSSQWKALAKQAGDLKDKVNDAREAINRYASDTKALDDVINIAQSATAAFTLAKGAMSAFGLETEGAVEAIQKLQGAMAVIQSLQTLQNTLKGSTATATLLTKSMNLLGIGMQGVSTTSKVLRMALASIGIGLIIIAVQELIEHWEDICGWFNKTFPILKKLGGAFNALKAVIAGVGGAIVNFLTNPIKTFANVIEKIFKGDFQGAIQAATEGIKNQFKGTADAFKTQFQNQVERGLEEITLKATEEDNKRTKHHLEMLKAQKGNAAKYSKEGIELQKKDFEQRKKLAKGNKEELDKIAIEEANFYRECQESKSKAAQAAAKKAADAAKKAAASAAERAKEEKEANERYWKDEFDMAIWEAEQEVKAAEQKVEEFINGPAEDLKNAMTELTNAQLRLVQAKIEKDEWDVFSQYKEDISGTTVSLEEFKNTMVSVSNLLKGKDTFNFDDFKEAAKDVKELSSLSETQLKKVYGDYLNYIRVLKTGIDNIAETRKKAVKTTDDYVKGLRDKDFAEQEKILGKEMKAIETTTLKYEAEGDKKSENAQRLIAILKSQWDTYLEHVKAVYTEDSKEYLEAQKKKKQDPIVGEKPKSSGGNRFQDFEDNGGVDWGDIKKYIEDAYDAFVAPIVGGITDTIGMMLEVAIEEAEAALEEAEEIHDKAVEKVESSKSRLSEINTEMADASASRLETLKAQQADEMLLLAQREAEEKRAEREKERREKELEKKKKQQRKLELQAQMVEALASGALAAVNGFATKPFVPVGLAMGALATTLTAVQLGVMAKQMSKLADGGLLQGPSHSQGGIPVGNTGIEVEGGEYVVNARSTRKYLPLLQQLNAEGARKKTVANQIGKFANGGQINYERVSSNLATQDVTKVIQSSIGSIDFQPVVSVVDINRGQKNLVNVRQIAGASK